MSSDKNTTRLAGEAAARERKALNTDNLSTQILFPKEPQKLVGSLTVVTGPGQGETLSLFAGTNSIGRADTNRVVMNFGDGTISREAHALITWDSSNGEFRLYDGGKLNPIKLNGETFPESRALRSGDQILIGETTVRFEAGA
jgi:hypothetical protein